MSIAQLKERHRAEIRSAAAKHSFEAIFYETVAQALPALQDAEIVFGQSVQLLKNAPHLRWICTPSAGVKHLTDTDCFVNADILLSNSSGAYGVTVAEHIIMVVLELMRRQQEYTQIIARHEWTRNLDVRSIHGSRITLLGTGDIGQEAAIRLRAFMPAVIVGVNRNGNNPRGLFDSVMTREQLDTVLLKTDLLILSLPDTSETNKIINGDRLALLPDGAFIVNVGRGNTIDQKALERELRAGRLHAALDVFDQEPLHGEDPLWDCPNLLITPHIAGNMTLNYTLDHIVELFLEDFENYCAGRPLARQVDLKKGY